MLQERTTCTHNGAVCLWLRRCSGTTHRSRLRHSRRRPPRRLRKPLPPPRAKRYGGQDGGQARRFRLRTGRTATADKPAAPIAPKTPPARPAYTRTDLQVGTGSEAQKGRGLSVHYTGWLYDPAQPEMKGRMFDSSRERGPFNFQLGAGQVIPGWDQGFDGMKVGGRRRLIIPPSLGYGVDGAGGGIIPPNATLLFEMELLDVK